MFKINESTGEARLDDQIIDAEALAVLREIAVAALASPREGDTFRFEGDRSAAEVVVGFRPGFDRLIVSGSPRLLAVEEAGSAVVIDQQRRRIVLEGVALAELKAGDIAIF